MAAISFVAMIEPAIAGPLPANQTGLNGSQIVNVMDLKNSKYPGYTDYYWAIQDAFAIAIATGRPLYFPTGIYTVSAATIQFLLNDTRTTGVTIFGDGTHQSIIDVRQVAGSPQLWVGSTSTVVGAEKNAPAGSNHSVNIHGIGIWTNTPGVGVRFGLPGTTDQVSGVQTGYTDPMNEPEISIFVSNSNTSSQASAVEMNYVLNGLIDLEANVAGPGTALVLNQLSFAEITGTLTALGGTGVQFKEGFNIGNILKNLSVQGTARAVVSQNPKGEHNTFVGGQFQYSRYGVDSSAGSDLIFLNPQALPIGAATAASFFGATVGVTVTSYGIAIPPRQSLAAPFLSAQNAINVMAPPYNAQGRDDINDYNAIKQAFNDALASGRPLYFPAGRYSTAGNPLVFSLGSQSRSVVIFGDGLDRSILDVRNAPSPQILVRDTTYANLKFVGIGVWGSTEGVTLQLGLADYSDSLQNAAIDLKVSNFNSAGTARAVQVNDVRNSTIRLVANTAGAGTGMELRQAISNYFSGSFGSWRGNSIWMRNEGWVVGNSFVALDMENVNVCVVNDDVGSWSNTFWGGRFAYSQDGIFSNAGQSLYVMNPNRGPEPSAGAFVGNGVALQLFH